MFPIVELLQSSSGSPLKLINVRPHCIPRTPASAGGGVVSIEHSTETCQPELNYMERSLEKLKTEKRV